MNLKERVQSLASAVAKKEGHKSQSRIGDIREVLGILADMSYESEEAMQTLVQLGIARAKRAKKVVNADK